MKRFIRWLCALLMVSGFRLSASEAIPNYAVLAPTNNVYSGNIVGYVNGGAGFAFSPLMDISVYSLGFNNGSLATNDFRVTLLDASWNPIAAAIINTSDSFFNQTYYEGISPLTLHSGNTYYLKAAEDFSGIWFGDVILASGPEANGTFSLAPEISWSGYVMGTTVYNDVEAYFVGPNFQFSPSIAVPEPSAFCLGALSFAALVLTRRAARP